MWRNSQDSKEQCQNWDISNLPEKKKQNYQSQKKFWSIHQNYPGVLENSPKLWGTMPKLRKNKFWRNLQNYCIVLGFSPKLASLSALALFLRVLENSPKLFVFFSFQFIFPNFKNRSKVWEGSPKLWENLQYSKRIKQNGGKKNGENLPNYQEVLENSPKLSWKNLQYLKKKQTKKTNKKKQNGEKQILEKISKTIKKFWRILQNFWKNLQYSKKKKIKKWRKKSFGENLQNSPKLHKK